MTAEEWSSRRDVTLAHIKTVEATLANLKSQILGHKMAPSTSQCFELMGIARNASRTCEDIDSWLDPERKV